MIDTQPEERIVRIVQTARPFEYKSPFPEKEHTLLICVPDEILTTDERDNIAKQVVEAKCRYALCWGHDCSPMEDSIDFAYIESDEDYNPPEETFIMTTSHNQEPIEEALEFWWLWTSFEKYESKRLAILIIGESPSFCARVETGIAALRRGREPETF